MPVSHARFSKPLGLLAVVAAALPAVSQADTMDYSFAELAYVDSEFGNQGGDGLSLRGSLPLNETFFVYAGYWDVGYDFIDITSFEVGAGGHLPLADKIDLVGRLGLVKSETDGRNFSSDDDGFSVSAHIRAALMPKLEVQGGFDIIDLGDRDTLIVLEGRYFFMENLAGGLRLEFGDDIDSTALGLRVTF